MPNPNEIMLAEQLAMHYQDTMYRIKKAKGEHWVNWHLTPTKKRQDMIEAFRIILAEANIAEAEDNQALRRPLKKPI